MKTVADLHAKVIVENLIVKHDDFIIQEIEHDLIRAIANELINNKELPINIEQSLIECRDQIECQIDVYLINKSLYEKLYFIGGYRLLKALSNMNVHEIRHLIEKHETKTMHNLDI